MIDTPAIKTTNSTMLKSISVYPVGSDRVTASRRQILGRGALAIGIVAAVGSLPTSGRAAFKVQKAQAGYKDTPAGGNECDRCIQFLPPSACKIVDGAGRPSGSCNYFAAKPK
jgi:hypothetical protein